MLKKKKKRNLKKKKKNLYVKWWECNQYFLNEKIIINYESNSNDHSVVDQIFQKIKGYFKCSSHDRLEYPNEGQQGSYYICMVGLKHWLFLHWHV